MKQILFWKYLDITGQLLMLLPLLYVIIPGERNSAILCYFTVGGWQAISCAIMAMTRTSSAGKFRKMYGWLLLGLLGLFIACTFLFLAFDALNAASIIKRPLGGIFGIIAWVEAEAMLIVAPIMAICYAGITVEEILTLKNALQHRSEIHWKL